VPTTASVLATEVTGNLGSIEMHTDRGLPPPDPHAEHAKALTRTDGSSFATHATELRSRMPWLTFRIYQSGS
jgi:hypothetical protein